MAGWSKGTEDTLSGKQAAKKERGALSVEQKLELSHMLRQEQDYNRMQMDQREMLVYGAKKKNRTERTYKNAGAGSGSGDSMGEDAEAKPDILCGTRFCFRTSFCDRAADAVRRA